MLQEMAGSSLFIRPQRFSWRSSKVHRCILSALLVKIIFGKRLLAKHQQKLVYPIIKINSHANGGDRLLVRFSRNEISGQNGFSQILSQRTSADVKSSARD